MKTNVKTPSITSLWEHRAERVLKVLVPVGCSAILIWWLFSKVNFRQVVDIISSGMIVWPILVMMAFNFMSYVIRGTRWGLQLDGVGVKVPEGELCISIFGAYAMNLVLYGLGEAWRCVYISRRRHVSLSTVVGTDMGDRGSDAVVVIMVLILSIFILHGPLDEFAMRYGIPEHISHLLKNYWLWGIILAVIGFYLLSRRIWHGCRVEEELETCLCNIWDGLKVIFTMRHRWLYVWLTLAIWTCYFMQTYVCFKSFSFTDVLYGPEYWYGILPGTLVMLFGSLSLAIPSSGGLGPWNLAVMFALECYGIPEAEAAAYALAVWSGQAILEIFLGLVTLVWLYRHPLRVNELKS